MITANAMKYLFTWFRSKHGEMILHGSKESDTVSSKWNQGARAEGLKTQQ